MDWWSEFTFIHDTGAALMSLFEEDLPQLMDQTRLGGARIDYPVVGRVPIHTSNGVVYRDLIEVEVTILNHHQKRLTAWTRVPCSLRTGGFTDLATSGLRVDGPFLQHMLYTATSPANPDQLHISTSRMWRRIPGSDPRDRRVPGIKTITDLEPANGRTRRVRVPFSRTGRPKAWPE